VSTAAILLSIQRGCVCAVPIRYMVCRIVCEYIIVSFAKRVTPPALSLFTVSPTVGAGTGTKECYLGLLYPTEDLKVCVLPLYIQCGVCDKPLLEFR
jgi:hypothetical protein